MQTDSALTQSFNPTQGKHINRYRIYLQVLTLSDIATADGKSLLPSAMDGLRDLQIHSTLVWPTQLPPAPQAWEQWWRFLSHFESSGCLTTPLDPWIHQTHQK
jgi:hypothetical protein